MHVLSGFIIREVAEQTIAIPSGEATKSLSGLLALNESGKFLFELLQNEQTPQSLVDAMQSEFDIDFDTAQADVTEFLEILRSSGILVES